MKTLKTLICLTAFSMASIHSKRKEVAKETKGDNNDTRRTKAAELLQKAVWHDELDRPGRQPRPETRPGCTVFALETRPDQKASAPEKRPV